jgi:hypothetical protein
VRYQATVDLCLPPRVDNTLRVAETYRLPRSQNRRVIDGQQDFPVQQNLGLAENQSQGYSIGENCCASLVFAATKPQIYVGEGGSNLRSSAQSAA